MMNDDFEAMLDESFAPEAKVSTGQKVEARVVSISSEYAFLDLGVREEGLLPLVEVQNEDGELTIKEGTVLTVLVTGHKEGAIMCAMRVGGAGSKAKGGDKDETIAALKEAWEAGMPVEGTVKESIKGGFNVTLMGVRAFCPISQIDNKYCEDPTEHVERTYSFEIIKFEESGRNLVLSRRKLLERDAEERAAEVWKTIEEGKSYNGTVSSLKEYGAFIDIGGVEGLLHVSEISHTRISDASEVLEAGQVITVAVKSMDTAKKKISFSLKALQEDPWDKAILGLTAGQIVTGKVVRLTNFGAFVSLTDGIEGLLHISEISKERRIHNPREVLENGQEVTVRILDIDTQTRRIGLSMNTDTTEEDWREELAQSGADKATGFGTLGDVLKKSMGKK